MFLDFVQAVIPRQQSTKKARELPPDTVRAAMADSQSDADAVPSQKNPPQLRAVSNAVTCKSKSKICRTLQQMRECELLPRQFSQMPIQRFIAISSPIQL
jgi:hypothetical protein